MLLQQPRQRSVTRPRCQREPSLCHNGPTAPPGPGVTTGTATPFVTQPRGLGVAAPGTGQRLRSAPGDFVHRGSQRIPDRAV